MKESAVVESLSALAQPQRLRAFRSLVLAGSAGLTPSVLSAQLGIAPNSLSFHLKALAHARLVTSQASGRNLIYRANFKAMNAVMAYLTQHCCDGEACELQPAGMRPTPTCP